MSARAVFIGVLIGLVAAVALAAVVIGLGAYNFAADAPHGGLTTRIIALARERAIEVRAEGLKVPPLGNPATIREGAVHYAAMCTGCHLAPGMPDNEMRLGLNPKPPALASLPPEEPAKQFWIVKHGLKMTAMPAWGMTHSDAEIWNIVAFLQRLPSLSPAQYRALTQGAHTHRPV
jgi:mono/diheme cytochrome c family protein